MKYFKKNKKDLRINLKINEQITIKFLNDCEFDFVKKNFGNYLTPSLFKRCKKFKLIPALIKDKKNLQVKLVLVKIDKKKLFQIFLKKEKFYFCGWLESKHFYNKREK